MNLSLARLSVNSINSSPFIASIHQLSISNSDFHRFFSYAVFNPSSLMVRETTFSYFRSTAVYMSQNLYQKRVFRDRSEITQPINTSDCIIKLCSFINCVTEQNGGCIFYTAANESGFLSVNQCLFRECQANSGAAVFTRSSRILFSRICCQKTRGINGSGSIFANGFDQEDTILLEHSVFLESNSYESGDVSIGVSHNQARYINGSRCRASLRIASLNQYSSGFSGMSFSVFADNIAPATVYLRGTATGILEHNIFYRNQNENTPNHGVLQLGGSSNIINSQFIENTGSLCDFYHTRFASTFEHCFFSSEKVEIPNITFHECHWQVLLFDTSLMKQLSTNKCTIFQSNQFSSSIIGRSSPPMVALLAFHLAVF